MCGTERTLLFSPFCDNVLVTHSEPCHLQLPENKRASATSCSISSSEAHFSTLNAALKISFLEQLKKIWLRRKTVPRHRMLIFDEI